MTALTPEAVGELERLLAAGTPGPWEVSRAEFDDDAPILVPSNYLGTCPDCGVRPGFGEADAALLAAMHTALPALLATARAHEALVAALRHKHGEDGCQWVGTRNLTTGGGDGHYECPLDADCILAAATTNGAGA